MTRQELFDRALNGVLQQGSYALDQGKCLYRTPDGRKCAAGQLIPDHLYAPKLEGLLVPHYTPDGSFVGKTLRKAGISPKDIPFVGQLQTIHDKAAHMGLPLSEWRERMTHLATQHNLSVPEPTP